MHGQLSSEKEKSGNKPFLTVFNTFLLSFSSASGFANGTSRSLSGPWSLVTSEMIALATIPRLVPSPDLVSVLFLTSASRSAVAVSSGLDFLSFFSFFEDLEILVVSSATGAITSLAFSFFSFFSFFSLLSFLSFEADRSLAIVIGIEVGSLEGCGCGCWWWALSEVQRWLRKKLFDGEASQTGTGVQGFRASTLGP